MNFLTTFLEDFGLDFIVANSFHCNFKENKNIFLFSYNPAVVQVWSDGSECDYGCYEWEVDCNMNIEPWGNCDPSGTNSSHGRKNFL